MMNRASFIKNEAKDEAPHEHRRNEHEQVNFVRTFKISFSRMKRIILLLAGVFIAGSSFSQVAEPKDVTKKDSVRYWQYGGVVMLNFGQTALSNWSAGGDNSQSGNSFFNFFANYKKKNISWDNTIDLGYGMLRRNEQLRKTDDKIDFSTKFGMAASKKWNYSALFNFKSQFTTGYKYPNDTTRIKISEFLAPAYIVTAIGMDYKPAKFFTAFISPLTGKITIVKNDSLADVGAFGVEKAQFDPVTKEKIKDGKNIREELGGFVKIAFQKDIIKNVNLSTKIDVFSNYVDNPQNVDIDWQVLISMKVNKFISASISTHLKYDDDYRPKNKVTGENDPAEIQFKEVLGVGFSYKFVKNGK